MGSLVSFNYILHEYTYKCIQHTAASNSMHDDGVDYDDVDDTHYTIRVP